MWNIGELIIAVHRPHNENGSYKDTQGFKGYRYKMVYLLHSIDKSTYYITNIIIKDVWKICIFV